MNKRVILAASLLSLCLSGCQGSVKYPEKAKDGAAWDKEWTILGTVLGVDEKSDEFTLLENPLILTGDDTLYATWTHGEATSIKNADGKDTDLYPAEIYLLLFGCEAPSYAEKNLDEWIAREYDIYDVTAENEVTINDQTYTLLSYNVTSKDNPNSYGISAFTIYDSYAISAELTCTDSYEGDAQSAMEDFLLRCHYAAD